MNRNLSRTKLRGCLWLIATVICGALVPASAIAGQPLEKSAAISQAIIEMIQDRWNLDKPQYEIELRRNPFLAGDFDRPGAFDSITITPLTRKLPRGTFPMLIDIYLDGKSVRHGQAAAYVEVFDSVLTLDYRSSKGTLALDLPLQLQFIRVTDIADAYITNTAELDDFRLKRNLQRGDILTRSALEQIPDVEFGQEVRIEYAGGRLTLSAAGYALQKGIVGETVRIRNLSSKRIIKAVVVGPGLVRIAAGVTSWRTK